MNDSGQGMSGGSTNPATPTTSTPNFSSVEPPVSQEPQIVSTGSNFVSTPTDSAGNQVPPASVTTIESKKGGRGFGAFVVIGVILILGIYGYVGYLYLQNQKLKSGSAGSSPTTNSETAVSPTPAFNKDFVKVSEGNVVYDDGASGTKIIVDKKNFTGTGITGFIKVSVSPDNTRVCFEAWPPAPSPALYFANVDGTEVVQVNDKRQNCLWTPDSKKLLYVDLPQSGKPSNVFLYDISTKEEKNLTETTQSQGSKSFGLVGLSADGTKAICKYEDAPKEEAGQCEIDLTSLEVSFL